MHVLNVYSAGVALVSSVCFVTVYSVVARWWRSAEGRLLVGVAVGVGLHGAAQIVGAWGDAVGVASLVWSAALMVRLTALAWWFQFATSGGSEK